jgi:hypothetical protein
VPAVYRDTRRSPSTADATPWAGFFHENKNLTRSMSFTTVAAADPNVLKKRKTRGQIWIISQGSKSLRAGERHGMFKVHFWLAEAGGFKRFQPHGG